MIKAKSDGLSLESHTQAVVSTALRINELGKFGVPKDVILWSARLHDVGKANPIFQSNMENKDFTVVLRHEVCSILFCKAIPEKIRDQVVFTILTHHKSIYGSDRSFYDMMENNEKVCIKNHVTGIEEWGKDVVEFLYDNFNIVAEIPTYDECVEIFNYYYDEFDNLERTWSKSRGLLQMADHFASKYCDDLERDNILNRMFKTIDTSFYRCKDERYKLSLIDSDETKRHTLTDGPCGSGKTNATMKRCNKRIFYILPFQASINAMYQRINKDINSDNQYMFGIKHASLSSLNFIDEETKEISDFFGTSFKVLTPFQIMAPLFGVKGYESVMLDIMGQDVILDEIHTYDGKNLTAVVELIKLLVSLDCNIHISSATMPSSLKKEIMDILKEENTQIMSLSNEDLHKYSRHRIHTEEYDRHKVIERYNRGEKVFVIRNTKNMAKQEYGILKELLPNANIMLIHSELKRKERAKLESKLYEMNRCSEACIVVSTQVVEVSLDVDFDVMFTDNADIMAIIQRIGRVARNTSGEVKDIYISEVIGSTLPYDEGMCARTYEALSKYNGNVLPVEDIQGIIDYVHPTVSTSVFDASPFDNNGNWKLKEYSNVTNSSISKMLDIVGMVAIVESDVDYYVKTKCQDVEIPISATNRRLINRLTPYNDNNDVVQFYIIPDEMYEENVGIIL